MSTSPVLYDPLGPRGRRRVAVASAVVGAAVLVVLAVAAWRLASRGQFESSRWEPFTRSGVIRFLLRGAWATVKAAAVAGVLAMTLGIILALLRLSRRASVRWPARVWLEFFRGFPLLLLIFFLARLFGEYGIDVSVFWILVTGLALYNGATFAEIFRAGILSVDRGQSEAALAIGLMPGQAMRLVVLPQAVRRMVPTLVSQFVTLLKDTSLGFVLPYEELLRRGRIIGEAYPTSLLQALIVVAAMYIAMNLTVSRVAVRLEARQSRRLGRVAPAVDVETEGVPTGRPA